MLNGFGHVDPVQVAWVKLNNLTQGVNDPPEYCRQFQAVCAELGASAPTGEALIQFFLRGLNPKLKTKVELKPDGSRWQGDDLQALVRQCTAIWPQVMSGVMASKSPSSASPSGTTDKGDEGSMASSKGKKRGFFSKGKNGAHGNNSAAKTTGQPNGKKAKLVSGPSGRMLSREQIEKLKKEGKCFVCEKQGHRSNECPQKKGDKSEN
jgi:hypothetical protein